MKKVFKKGTFILSIIFIFYSNSNAQNKIETSGNVGIGTMSPLVRLSVYGPSDDSAAISLQSATNSRFYIQQGGSVLKIGGTAPGVGIINVTNTGNVGVGTTSPEGKLDVYGPVFINTNANLNLKASTISPLDPGDVVFVANNNTEYARIYTNPGGNDLRFSVGPTPTPRMTVTNAGNVGIGTTNPGANKLAVEGMIGARRVKVDQETWADFVFEPEYKLPSLTELERYIKINKHLPDVPSAAEVAKEKLDLGEMNKILLQKIEELTLHLIELEKKMNTLENKNNK
jgi:hypothetical protein